MQFERAPVLRFTVGASILFVLSMLAFGRLILETRARAQVAEAARQHELAERDSARRRLDVVKAQSADLDARIDNLMRSLEQLQDQIDRNSGCQMGNARDLRRLREQLQEARDARQAAQERVDGLRCRQQPGCTVLY